MPQEQNKKLYMIWWALIIIVILIVVFIRRIISDGQSQKFIDNKIKPSDQFIWQIQSWYVLESNLSWFTIKLPIRTKESDYQKIKKIFLPLWVSEVTTWKASNSQILSFEKYNRNAKQDVDFGLIQSDYQDYQNIYFVPWAIDYPVLYYNSWLYLQKSINFSDFSIKNLNLQICWWFSYFPISTLDRSMIAKKIDFYEWFLDVAWLLWANLWLTSSLLTQQSNQQRNQNSLRVKKLLRSQCDLWCLISTEQICGSVMLLSQVLNNNTWNLQSLALIEDTQWYLYWRKSTQPLSKNIVDLLYEWWIYFWLKPVTNSQSDLSNSIIEYSNQPIVIFTGWLISSN
jgi:hypothetical protein